jgi:hypothetical protein
LRTRAISTSRSARSQIETPPSRIAEIGLAVAGEDLGNGGGGGALDLGVGIDEGQLQPRRDALADRGLAGAHEADQDDGAPVQPVEQGQPFGFVDAGGELLHVLPAPPFPADRSGRHSAAGPVKRARPTIPFTSGQRADVHDFPPSGGVPGSP